MKKIIITMLLLSFITACTIEDQSVDINDLNLQTEDIECVIDIGYSPSIMGSEFVRDSYILETAVDINGDGVYSTDLKDEGLCGADVLRFKDNFKVWNVLSSFVSLRIDQNNQQIIHCSHADGTFPFYIQTENNIDFCFAGNISYTGTLSDDGNTLTFTLPYEQLYGLSDGYNEILMPDGTIENYEGNAVITYTRL